MSDDADNRGAITKLLPGTGVGLGSGAVIMWMLSFFAPKSDMSHVQTAVDELKKDVAVMQEHYSGINTKVEVLDAIRKNQQAPERSRYE